MERIIELLKKYSPADFLQWLDDKLLNEEGTLILKDKIVDSFIYFCQTIGQNWLWAWHKHPEWWAVANVILIYVAYILIRDFVRWVRRRKCIF